MRIKYLTEGMLLQEMLRDPWLKQYSAVIVDEIHERGVDVDLVSGFLRKIVHGAKEGRGGVPLKVVVMSATVDFEGLHTFFSGATDGGKTDKAGQNAKNESPDPSTDNAKGALANESKENVDHSDSESSYSSWSGFSTDKDDDSKTPDAAGLTPDVALTHIEGRQYPVKILYSPEPVQDYVEGMLKTIFQIHQAEPMPGDVLAFLTGQEEIDMLAALLNDYAEGLRADVPKVRSLCLTL
jgi:ATP-dependent RNA helicase DHR2